jgi:hypothetical protein
MSNIRTCALAIAAVLCIGSQASADPRVTVENTPLPVTVTNSPPPILGTPTQFSLPSSGSFTFNVPPGKLLVIEYISGECNLLNTPSPSLLISTQIAGNVLPHSIAMPAGIFTQNVEFGQVVKLYSDTSVALSVAPSAAQCGLVFSGLLVNP